VLRRLFSSTGEEDFNLEQFGPEFASDRPLNLDRESAGGLKVARKGLLKELGITSDHLTRGY